MRSVLVVAILLLISSTAAQRVTKLSDLGWMSGCWEFNDEKLGMLISEMWMKPSGNAMMGVGRTIKSGKLVDFEFLRIVEDANGIAYISRPSENKEDTSFKMIRSSTGEVVFENAAHDFPQRIIYWKDGADLRARIEGPQGGKTVGEEWRWAPLPK